VTRAKIEPTQRLRRPAAFTLIEVLVVVAIIALLIAVLLPSLSRAKEVSKRTICLHNTKMLGECWELYHTENKGRLMGACAAYEQETDTTFLNRNAPCWTRYIGTTPAQQSTTKQTWALTNGAMHKYARHLDIYHCPAIQKDEIRTYSGNWGVARLLDVNGNQNWYGRPSYRIDQLKPPGARMVFIDDFPEDWDAVWTITPWNFQFWNPIAARHDKGTTMGFADGHSELWRWTDPDTIKFVAMSWAEAENYSPPIMPNNRDIKRLQLASWGKLDNSGNP
jgi:prepilin-type N-terminal cleavage/methylation domain-containing protein/prepilin-type processing-associated H-X9-DG protein